jgi:hypothetical protein
MLLSESHAVAVASTQVGRLFVAFIFLMAGAAAFKTWVAMAGPGPTPPGPTAQRTQSRQSCSITASGLCRTRFDDLTKGQPRLAQRQRSEALQPLLLPKTSREL